MALELSVMRNQIFSFITHKAGGNFHFSVWEVAVAVLCFVLGNELVNLFVGMAAAVLGGAAMLGLRRRSNNRIDHLEILARKIIKRRKVNVCERDERSRPFPYQL